MSCVTHPLHHSLLFLQCSHHHQQLHSFPTRRSSDLRPGAKPEALAAAGKNHRRGRQALEQRPHRHDFRPLDRGDRKSTRLNSSHTVISYAVFCLKKKKKIKYEKNKEIRDITIKRVIV